MQIVTPDFQISSHIEDLNKTKWSEFIKTNPRGNIFQSPEMYEFYSNVNGYEPDIFSVVDDNGNIHGLLLALTQRERGLLGYFSSRSLIWGGPLFRAWQYENRVAELLLKKANAILSRKSIYVEFRNLFDLSAFKPVFESNRFTYHAHLNFIVSTMDRESTIKRISKSKLRQIKNSLNSGAEIIEPEHIEQVAEFYKILKNLYRIKVKKPIPPWSFFKNFYQFSREGKLGKYLLIQYQGQIIGGIMCPITPGKTIYEWYIAGLDGEYKNIYSSVLATWAAIDYALNTDLKQFDFMGAGKPDEDYGVREFKSKFGGELVSFGRFHRVNSKILFKIGKAGIKILKKI